MDFNYNKKGPPMTEVFFCNGDVWGRLRHCNDLVEPSSLIEVKAYRNKD